MGTNLSRICSIFERLSIGKQEKELNSNIISLADWHHILDELVLIEVLPIEINPDLSFASIFKGIYETAGITKSFVEINLDTKDLLIEDLYELTFTSLYPQIIHLLIKSGKAQQTTALRIFCFIFENREYFKKNLSTRAYYLYKTWINWFYGRLPIVDPEFNDKEVVGASHVILKGISEFVDEFYCGDTDQIWFYHHKIDEIKEKVQNDYPLLEFEILQIKSAIFMGKKKYAIGDIETRGIKKYERKYKI